MESIKRSKTLYLMIIIATIYSCSICNAKSIELNGLKLEIITEVEKEVVTIGSKVNEDNKFSSAQDEKKEKEGKDKNVKVELIVKNENPYEKTNVTIEEIMPNGFRQVEGKEKESIVKEKIDSKTKKLYNYSYRYHKSFLKDQYKSITYDNEGNIIDKNEDIRYEEINKNNNEKQTSKINKDINNSSNKGNIEEESKDLQKGAFGISKFLIAFIVCVIILFAFVMCYKAIKGNDDNFFNNEDKFRCIIIFITLSILFNISFNKVVYAKNIYEPQIYEYGKIYEKVIFETVEFNGMLYKFAYKVSFYFDNNYEITDEDYEKDTDGDGLSDALEYLYMTDKNNVDTDGDGISDYIEVMLLDYNPLSDDTFNDGIKDGDRDFDNDKLTNIEEVHLGTDLHNPDTDYDTLTDYDEINIYKTDPLNVDTDGDLLIDPDEIKLGLDPNNPRTDGVTLDSERKIQQEYSMDKVPEYLREGDVFIKNISGKVSGNIDKEIKISKNNEEVFNSMSSFVQSGFEVSLKEDEKIDVEFDVSKVSDRKTYFVVVRYVDGKLELIDTTCEENILKASIGNGIYTVMDSDIALRDLSIFIKDYVG